MKRKMRQIFSFVLLFSIIAANRSDGTTANAASKGYVKGFRVSKNQISCSIGQSKNISYNIKVKKSASKKISVKAADAEIVSVKVKNSKIVVTGKKSGTTKVYATTKGKNKKGKKIKATIHVTVTGTGASDDNVATAAPQETTVPSATAVAQATPVPSATSGPEATPVPSEAVTLSNPRTDDDGVTTWDCVYFGSYWQNDTNGDGVADQNDEKEPIKWRVLSVEGDDAFLLADQCLDCKSYNTTNKEVTWETCTLRSWLNGYGSGSNVCGTDCSSDCFLDTAFSQEEQLTIRSTTVINSDNLIYGSKGGNNTADKIYLLSLDEISASSYGFHTEYGSNSSGRIAVNTAYAKTQGAETFNDYTNMGSGCWWLRSPGDSNGDAAYVTYGGQGENYGNSVSCNDSVIRPALHLNLKAASEAVLSNLYSYAGTISFRGGKVKEMVDSSIKPSSPRTDENGVTTWDCVWFGNYWQNDTNGDGKVDQNDEKEPIKWRVLSVEGDDAFLLADQSLDCQRYHKQEYVGSIDITWEICTLRSWLNGYGSSSNATGGAVGTDYSSNNFIDAAFSQTEQSAIRNTVVVNEDNPYYGTEGGDNTTDKVYLLSIAEACTPSYGFNSKYYINTDTRISVNTAYAKALSTSWTSYTSLGSGCWWLRSPGFGSEDAASVDLGGYGRNTGFYGEEMSNKFVVVRPALHLNLSAANLYTYAGTVSLCGGNIS